MKKPESRLFWSAPLLLLCLANASTAWHYAVQSGLATLSAQSGLEALSGASSARLLSQLRTLPNGIVSPRVVCDTPHQVLAKICSLYLRGKNVSFPSRDVFGNVVGEGWGPRGSALASAELGLLAARRERFLRRTFDLKSAGPGPRENTFVLDKDAPPSDCAAEDASFVTAPLAQSIINRSRLRGRDPAVFTAQPWNAVRDRLIFLSSQLGWHYYLGDPKNVGLFQTEADPALRDSPVAGVGRHLLFEVIHPSKEFRAVLEITATFRGDGDNRVPPAAVIGEERLPFPAAGRGAARLFSPPVKPQQIEGRLYLAIDLGAEGTRYPEQRTGLMRLFGAGVPLDARRLVCLARDISLISEQEYSRQPRPAAVSAFPRDLADPTLEYSGIYEDGWISEQGYVVLSQPPGWGQLVASGFLLPVHGDPSAAKISMLLDGEELARAQVHQGHFELRAAAPPRPRPRRVDLRFSKAGRLPAPDKRPAAAHLDFVGFVPGEPHQAASPRAPSGTGR